MSNRWGGRVSVSDPRFGLHAFREFVQHVQEAVIPASLFCRVRPDFRHSRPDSQVGISSGKPLLLLAGV